MKRIALITLAGLTIFATAAIANQAGWGPGSHTNGTHGKQMVNNGGGCPMNPNMMGRGMSNGSRGMMGPGMQGAVGQGEVTNTNWRANPSYQGKTTTTATVK